VRCPRSSHRNRLARAAIQRRGPVQKHLKAVWSWFWPGHRCARCVLCGSIRAPGRPAPAALAPRLPVCPHASAPALPALCGSTGLGSRSRYVFMVFALRSSVVRGVSPTPCGSPREINGSAVVGRWANISWGEATRTPGRNPRSLRRAATAFAFIESHTV
jgi:hypothetical protein